MRFDAYLDGRLLAQDLVAATVADLAKLEVVDIAWAVEQHGHCDLLDDSGRSLTFIAHGDDLAASEEG